MQRVEVYRKGCDELEVASITQPKQSHTNSVDSTEYFVNVLKVSMMNVVRIVRLGYTPQQERQDP